MENHSAAHNPIRKLLEDYASPQNSTLISHYTIE